MFSLFFHTGFATEGGATSGERLCVCYQQSMEALFAVLLFYLVSIFGKTASPHKTEKKW